MSIETPHIRREPLDHRGDCSYMPAEVNLPTTRLIFNLNGQPATFIRWGECLYLPMPSKPAEIGIKIDNLTSQQAGFPIFIGTFNLFHGGPKHPASCTRNDMWTINPKGTRLITLNYNPSPPTLHREVLPSGVVPDLRIYRYPDELLLKLNLENKEMLERVLNFR